MCDVHSATVGEHLDSKTLRFVDASWPFVYWNFFLFYILLYRVVNEWQNKSLSLSLLPLSHLSCFEIVSRSMQTHLCCRWTKNPLFGNKLLQPIFLSGQEKGKQLDLS